MVFELLISALGLKSGDEHLFVVSRLLEVQVLALWGPEVIKVLLLVCLVPERSSHLLLLMLLLHHFNLILSLPLILELGVYLQAPHLAELLGDIYLLSLMSCRRAFDIWLGELIVSLLERSDQILEQLLASFRALTLHLVGLGDDLSVLREDTFQESS